MSQSCCSKCCMDESPEVKHTDMENSTCDSKLHKLKEYWKMGLSALLLITGIMLHLLNVSFFQNSNIQLCWYVMAYLPVGLPVIKEAWETITHKDYFSEFTLMSVATFGAFYIGEYPEAVAVMLFYAIGEMFQEKAVRGAKRSIKALLDIRPETAVVVQGINRLVKTPSKVRIDEIIEVKTGERVPLDGILLNETASFNTSALTGESIPRQIQKDEEVLAGMIVTDRVIQLRVTKSFNNSALARILELVQNASERKAPAELFIRKFARIYTPIVIGLALSVVLLPFIYSFLNTGFIYVFDRCLYKGLIFLIISCPCALVISIPLGYFAGIGAASRKGILFKGGNYLEAITHIDTIVFDKTGTLTKGSFAVQTCQPATGFTIEELIGTVASTEQYSTHPIAKAIVSYAANRQIALHPVDKVQEISGYGLKAISESKEVLTGNIKLLYQQQIDFPEELLTVTDTIVACSINSVYAGYILLSDTLKEDAATAIHRLKALNISNIQILSGDKQSIVTNFAKKLEVVEAYGDLLPEGKVKHIEQLRHKEGRQVAFVGDGINDAPVLALSNVGIAMGGLGSDAAIETADVIIQTDHPSKVALAIEIGKYTRRIIWQNMMLIFGIKLLVMLLGTLGIATIWEAVFADVGVTLLAVLNAMRIQKNLA